MSKLPNARLTLHFPGCKSVVTHHEYEQTEVAIDAVLAEIDDDEPAGWRVLGDVVFFSKAVSAIEVDELS